MSVHEPIGRLTAALRQIPDQERAAYGPADRDTGSPQWIPLAVGVALAALLLWGVSLVARPTLVGGAVLGLALGVALFHSRFGFSSGWRQLVALGQGAAVRAHLLMLAVATILFGIVFATGFSFAGEPRGYVSPVGISLVVGAFLFGLGMQVGGSCASGTLFAVGSGQSAIVLTLGGFVIGSVLAALSYPFWFQTLPQGPSISLSVLFGLPGAVALSLVVLLALAAVTYAIARRRTPPPLERPATAHGLLRIVRGAWPLWVGAVVLAGLNAAVLVVTGQPWGVTSAFGLWGAKVLQFFGAEPQNWAFWKVPANATMLAGPVLADRVSVLDLGIMVGALIASAAGGAFVLHRKIPAGLALGAVLGGVAMGYGARLASGCNIGAYFSGIASLSVHGWVWGAVALVGTWVGLRLRPLFGLSNPKPTDSIC